MLVFYTKDVKVSPSALVHMQSHRQAHPTNVQYHHSSAVAVTYLARVQVPRYKCYLCRSAWPWPNFPDLRLERIAGLHRSSETSPKEPERLGIIPTDCLDNRASREAICGKAMQNNTTESSRFADFRV